MSTRIALAIFIVAAIESASSQHLDSKDRTNRNEDYVWTYSVTRTISTEPLILRLAIPISARVRQLEPISGIKFRKERLGTGNLIQLKFTPLSKKCEQSQAQRTNIFQTFTFEVFSLRSVTKPGEIEWTIEASPDNITGVVRGPTVLYDASILRPVLAAGGSVRFDDVVDFKIENGVMLIQNDSSLRPSVIAGVLLKLFDFQELFGWRMTEKKTVDFILSLEFANATSKSLDGFIFGVGLGVNRYLEFFGGVSIRTGQEISHGFRQSAQQMVNEIQNNSDEKITETVKSNFERFNNLASSDESFDGFPTINPLTNGPVFPGSPLVASTNKAFVFGVALPVDIFNLIRGQ